MVKTYFSIGNYLQEQSELLGKSGSQSDRRTSRLIGEIANIFTDRKTKHRSFADKLELVEALSSRYDSDTARLASDIYFRAIGQSLDRGSLRRERRTTEYGARVENKARSIAEERYKSYMVSREAVSSQAEESRNDRVASQIDSGLFNRSMRMAASLTLVASSLAYSGSCNSPKLENVVQTNYDSAKRSDFGVVAEPITSNSENTIAKENNRNMLRKFGRGIRRAYQKFVRGTSELVNSGSQISGDGQRAIDFLANLKPAEEEGVRYSTPFEGLSEIIQQRLAEYRATEERMEMERSEEGRVETERNNAERMLETFRNMREEIRQEEEKRYVPTHGDSWRQQQKQSIRIGSNLIEEIVDESESLHSPAEGEFEVFDIRGYRAMTNGQYYVSFIGNNRQKIDGERKYDVAGEDVLSNPLLTTTFFPNTTLTDAMNDEIARVLSGPVTPEIIAQAEVQFEEIENEAYARMTLEERMLLEREEYQTFLAQNGARPEFNRLLGAGDKLGTIMFGNGNFARFAEAHREN